MGFFQDVALFINQFQAPSNIENLKIQNCDFLTLSTRCSSEVRPVQKLEVVNIGVLTFQRLGFTSMLPPTVIMENVSHVDFIPTGTFNQMEKPYQSSGCYAAFLDFQNLYLKNVTIDLVQSNAFVGMKQFNNFSWVNVQVNRLQTSAIRLNLGLNGGFEMRNCTVKMVEPLGVQVFGRSGVFAGTHFQEIASSGINGTLEEFYFVNNYVELMEPQGLALLAMNTLIVDNHFEHMKSGALEKLSPGLIQGLGTNFGKLKFIYDFSNNVVSRMDFGSLHPDYISYENVPTQMMFSRNHIACDCDNVKWLFSFTNNFLETFYEMVLDEEYANVCLGYDRECQVSLMQVKGIVDCSQCVQNFSLSNLCKTPKLSVVEEITEYLPAAMVQSEISNGSFTISSMLNIIIGSFLAALIIVN